MGSKAKNVFLICLVMMSLLAVAVPVKAEDYIVIDVLCAGDEEFMADPENVEDAEIAIQDANDLTGSGSSDCFETTFGVHFAVRGWVGWDSPDSEHVAINLAYQAWMQVTGGAPISGFRHNGYVIDMLCAFTGQDDIIDLEEVTTYAKSYPDANITLVTEEVADNHRTFRHEFSHQFSHDWECGWWCVMNPAFVDGWITVDSWCDGCKDYINAHKHKWPVDYHLSIYSSPGGTTDPAPGSHFYREGTSVNITALPIPHREFYFWSLDGVAPIWENPIAVVMTSDHTLDAYFQYVNHAPEIPSIGGSTSGYVNQTYVYTTSTTDLDGDEVLYEFDWGDGTNTTTGFYASGVAVHVPHSWSDTGTYDVKVRAQDFLGEWSNWSSLTVAISTGGSGGGPYEHKKW